MATVTPNFNWPVPTSTDLVRDGATAIEALGDSIDASLVDLKGGTTGQVLSKTSATDMDFTWVTSDDANAIQNAIVDAKGDLIAASAADTPARLAVGANGETLVADSAATTGLRYQSNFAAGKNAIINGAFNVWQRGTSYTLSAISTYGAADRFRYWHNGSTVGTNTVSQETFTPGSAPVAGYESQFFQRATTTTLGTSQTVFDTWQRVEDVRTFAGQAITFSVWAKSSGSRNLTLEVAQNFGSGGSTQVTTTILSSTATTTGWVRYSGTITMPSVSGKTIGTNSYLNMAIRFSGVVAGDTFDIWGVQLEAGSVATAFQTATGTIQGELAACQRYYYRAGGASAFTLVAPLGYLITTTLCRANIQLPVSMRTTPTSVDFSTIEWVNFGTAQRSITAVTINTNFSSNFAVVPELTLASTDAIYSTGYIRANNSTSGYLGFSAEL